MERLTLGIQAIFLFLCFGHFEEWLHCSRCEWVEYHVHALWTIRDGDTRQRNKQFMQNWEIVFSKAIALFEAQ